MPKTDVSRYTSGPSAGFWNKVSRYYMSDIVLWRCKKIIWRYQSARLQPLVPVAGTMVCVQWPVQYTATSCTRHQLCSPHTLYSTVLYTPGVSLLTDTDAIYNVALCLFQLSTWAEMQSLTRHNVALVICEPRVWPWSGRLGAAWCEGEYLMWSTNVNGGECEEVTDTGHFSSPHNRGICLQIWRLWTRGKCSGSAASTRRK